MKAIIFDIDDTLVTHSEAVEESVRVFYDEFFNFREVNFEDFFDIWIRKQNKFIKEYLEGELTFEEQRIRRLLEIFREMGKDIDEDMAKEYFDFYLSVYEKNWRLFPDVVGCLEALERYKLGVVSNGDSDQQRKKLRNTDIEDYFDSIVISGDYCFEKPDSRVFLRALESVGINADEALYIGDDYEMDFLPAADAGLHSCLLDRSSNKSFYFIGDGYGINSLNRVNKVLLKLR